ncbi:inositol monophosphatase family protein [Parvularcula marina]|uniref:inositol monophosphatase family protein n=1 Tax=Parvularcula marina TaxID=2292771 RepID=UPI003518C9D0
MTGPLPELGPLFDRLITIAAGETLPRFRMGTAITDKGGAKGLAYDPVTEADQEAERMLRIAIEEAYPGHGILGEEHGEKPGTEDWRWVIDPVDGTRAFVCGVPFWTTLIGLEDDAMPVGGIISQPFLDEHWLRLPGEATLYRQGTNLTPARVSGETDLGDATIMVTDLRVGEYFTEDEARAVTSLTKACRLCRTGLDSYGFGLVASGHMDIVVEAALNWHDIAAVLPVIEGAGGVACSWDGAPITQDFVRGRVILAASQELADAAVSQLRDVPLP